MTKPANRRPPTPEAGWAYFLDVDGTLLDIAETPDSVDVDKQLLDLIAQLHRASGGALAGLHGLERRDVAGRLWIHAAPPQAKCAIKAALLPIQARHPGLFIEDKGLTLALHYRQAPSLAGYVHHLMRQLAASAGDGLELQYGKMVVEIKPAGIDKGSAVSEYLNEPPFCQRRPVFIGDDLNDEHGFAEVNRLDGISIKVGPGKSCARYRLADVVAVRNWLGAALKGQP